MLIKLGIAASSPLHHRYLVKLTLTIGLTCLPHRAPSWCYVSLGPEFCITSSMMSVGLKQSMDHTAIELTGSGRPGLLSELSFVLRHLKCNVVNAEVRIYNTCTGCDASAEAVMQVTDEEKGSADAGSERLILDRKIFCAMCLMEATNPV
ncbi:hypothetical protein CRYUN_Cryun31cG0019900 [Craigia yunnanensis]